MKKRIFPLFAILLLSFALSFVYQACSSSESSLIIAGRVTDQDTGDPIINGVVEIAQPENLQQTATTDSSGNFSFDITRLNKTVEIFLEISKQGYEDGVASFKMAPDTDVDDLRIRLLANTGVGADDQGGVSGEPEGPAAIILEEISNQAINIQATGDQVSTAFSFVVQDSAGRPLNSEGAVDVHFDILSGPGGAEEIVPESDRTNAQGRVTSALFSGNVAGPVKVQASIERPELGITITSTPVLVAIHGGFPDDEHFSIAPSKFNFEGYSFNNIRNPITVIVGDQFSNPVKPGTVVYFSTTGGVIQGSGETDPNGIVTVDLISADPRPTDDIAGSGGRPGYATVTATTVNADDERISKDINVVFSTTSAQISGSPTTFDLQPNGGTSFSYTVMDQNGNPMAAGTTIDIQAGNAMEVSGDANFTLGDHLFPGPGATEFNFSIRDVGSLTDDPAPLTILISVTTPTGNTTTYSEISGTRRKSTGE